MNEWVFLCNVIISTAKVNINMHYISIFVAKVSDIIWQRQKSCNIFSVKYAHQGSATLTDDRFDVNPSVALSLALKYGDQYGIIN